MLVYATTTSASSLFLNVAVVELYNVIALATISFALAFIPFSLSSHTLSNLLAKGIFTSLPHSSLPRTDLQELNVPHLLYLYFARL